MTEHGKISWDLIEFQAGKSCISAEFCENSRTTLILSPKMLCRQWKNAVKIRDTITQTSISEYPFSFPLSSCYGSYPLANGFANPTFDMVLRVPVTRKNFYKLKITELWQQNLSLSCKTLWFITVPCVLDKLGIFAHKLLCMQELLLSFKFLLIALKNMQLFWGWKGMLGKCGGKIFH